MYVAKFLERKTPSNFAICQKRTINLLNKLRSSPELLKIYDNSILEKDKR